MVMTEILGYQGRKCAMWNWMSSPLLPTCGTRARIVNSVKSIPEKDAWIHPTGMGMELEITDGWWKYYGNYAQVWWMRVNCHQLHSFKLCSGLMVEGELPSTSFIFYKVNLFFNSLKQLVFNWILCVFKICHISRFYNINAFLVYPKPVISCRSHSVCENVLSPYTRNLIFQLVLQFARIEGGALQLDNNNFDSIIGKYGVSWLL